MLAANVCSADFIHRARHPALFRVHEGPTKDKLTQLRTFLRTCSLTLGGGSDPSPLDYRELFMKIRGRDDSELLQTMMLRSMQQAVYTPENSGHFGLAYDAYTHFTSPIRRYPDLLVHRVIKACINKTKYTPALSAAVANVAGVVLDDDPHNQGIKHKSSKKRVARATSDSATTKATWQALGTMCSTNERRADDASRDVHAWLKSQFMRDRVGEEFSGRITGVAPFGIFVTLDSLHVEGMVHVSELGSDYFQYNESGHSLIGERSGTRYRLTDTIRVQVSRVDLEARRIEFRLATQISSGPSKSKKSDTRPRKTKKAASAASDEVRRVRAERQANRDKDSKPRKKAKSKTKNAKKTASKRGPKPASTKRKGPSKKAIKGKKKRVSGRSARKSK